MNIVFSGFSRPIEVSSSFVRTIEIENKVLFTRVCQSLLSGAGEFAKEPYSLWDEKDAELAATTAFLSVSNPLALPWDSKDLAGKLYRRLEQLMLEDEEAREEIERLSIEIDSSILRLTHQVNGDYSFAVEWGLRKYLKSFSFFVDRDENASYLDSLNTFLDFAADMSLKKVLLFVNLKTFLSGNEYEQILERIFFHGFSVMLLESTVDSAVYALEKKTIIDQHFLEVG